MEQLRITSESLFKWTVSLMAIPTVLLLLGAYVLVFVAFGVGWAYGGPAGCHFVLNPLGMTMVIGTVLGISAFLFFAGRRIVHYLKNY